jgi:hypothetical protein
VYLTDDTKEQSIARSGGDLGNKGEAAVTALRMIDFKRIYPAKRKHRIWTFLIDNKRKRSLIKLLFYCLTYKMRNKTTLIIGN